MVNDLETPTQSDTSSFASNPDLVGGTQFIVEETLANLVNIAFGSEQEFSVVTDKNTNAILLTHKYYGLDDADVNLNKFLDTNRIGLSEVLEIPKGREIKYYK
jgi:hypothetical protein